MKLNIVMRCSACNRLLDYTHAIDQDGVVIFVKDPCPNCHPSKPENVTPGKGESVEVRGNDYPEGSHSTRTATGRRHDGFVETNSLNASTAWWDQWRYPGETDDEWKD